MIGIQRELSPFFHFSDLGILLYDREKDKFFTIQIDQERLKHDPKKKAEEFENVNNMENLCPSVKELIFYPVNFGLSGYSFHTQVIQSWCQKTEKEAVERQAKQN
jgi:hypothetical protein